MGSVRLRNKKYYIDYTAYGKRYRECIGPDKKLAKQVLNKRMLEIAEDKFLDKKQFTNILFDTLADLYLEQHAKPNTISWKSNHLVRIRSLKKHFGGKMINTITQENVERFKNIRIKEVSPSTVNKELTVLKHIFNKGIDWDKVENNPAKRVKKFRENNSRLRYLTEEEISLLISNATGYMRTLVILAVNTGMRKGEMLNLKWHDIDFALGLIYLIHTKNGENRNVPMNNTVITTLKEHSKHPGDYVFSGKEGLPLKNIDKNFKNLLKQSKIENFKFHDLRHTFASQLAMKGIDLNMIRELLGHKSINMTLRYSHLAPSHKQKAVEILSFQGI